MNFAQMLMRDFTPPVAPVVPKVWERDTKTANVAVRSKAIRKYTAAVGPNWTRTLDVAARIGMERMSVFKQLVRYMNLGILERRPLGGRPFNQHTGWEWRVK